MMRKGLARFIGNVSAITALCSTVYVKLNTASSVTNGIDTLMMISVIVLTLVYFGTLDTENSKTNSKGKNTRTNNRHK